LTIGMELTSRPQSAAQTDDGATIPLPTLTKHCCVCGSEKLPFAGYSVVKDRPGEISPSANFGARGRFPPDPLGSLACGAPSPHAARSP